MLRLFTYHKIGVFLRLFIAKCAIAYRKLPVIWRLFFAYCVWFYDYSKICRIIIFRCFISWQPLFLQLLSIVAKTHTRLIIWLKWLKSIEQCVHSFQPHFTPAETFDKPGQQKLVFFQTTRKTNQLKTSHPYLSLLIHSLPVLLLKIFLNSAVAVLGSLYGVLWCWPLSPTLPHRLNNTQRSFALWWIIWKSWRFHPLSKKLW